MELIDSPIHQWIDNNRLTPVVRQVVGREALQLQDWRVTQLGGNAGNPVSLGLYRYEGIGQDRGRDSRLVGYPEDPAIAG